MKTLNKLASRTYRAFENDTSNHENRRATGVVLENGAFFQVYPKKREFYNLASWKEYCLKKYKKCVIEGAEENYYKYRMEVSSQSGDFNSDSDLGRSDIKLRKKMEGYWKNIQKRPDIKSRNNLRK